MDDKQRKLFKHYAWTQFAMYGLSARALQGLIKSAFNPYTARGRRSRLEAILLYERFKPLYQKIEMKRASK